MSEDGIEFGSDEWWERQLAEDRRYYFLRNLNRQFGIDFESEPARGADTPATKGE